MPFPSAGSPAGSKQLWDYTINFNNFSNSSITINAGVTQTLFTLTGKGIIGNVQMRLPAAGLMPVISIDGGPDIDLAVNESTVAKRTVFGGYNSPNPTTTNVFPQVLSLDFYLKFKSSFAIKLRNITASAVGSDIVANTIYYT